MTGLDKCALYKKQVGRADQHDVARISHACLMWGVLLYLSRSRRQVGYPEEQTPTLSNLVRVPALPLSAV